MTTTTYIFQKRTESSALMDFFAFIKLGFVLHITLLHKINLRNITLPDIGMKILYHNFIGNINNNNYSLGLV